MLGWIGGVTILKSQLRCNADSIGIFAVAQILHGSPINLCVPSSGSGVRHRDDRNGRRYPEEN